MVSVPSDFVGPYELLRLLGHGNFCAVYEARDRTTGEHMALKQLRRVGPISLSNFKREFRTVQGLHHPNLVELLELFEFAGACFIAMELVDGTDLVSYLRGGPAGRLDYARLGQTFGQLAQALIALHTAGVLHRDLKPRNVLVTPQGRVVLLDFGLAKNLTAPEQTDDPGLGSAAYMAPEQFTGAALSASADFYAFGVCLFEALTGRTPFPATKPHELLELKERGLPPQTNLAGVPSALSTLCLRLLDPISERRPSAREILNAFDAPAPGVRASAPPPAPTEEDFAGREPELAELARGFARSRAGAFVLMLIEGESGIGKSALAAEFLQRLRVQEPSALVLRSRCYENELLAYKAFDGGMEQLAHALAALSLEDCQALLPPRAILLPRLFDALSSVRAFADAPGRSVPAEPAAQRLAAFGALCKLLSNLSQTRPLVLAIDDLQWADPESFQLLRAIGNQPEPPPVLILATLRPARERSPACESAIASVRALPNTVLLSLQGLAGAEAHALAARMLRSNADAELARVLVVESGGHPLFLSELARFVERPGDKPAARITLDGALRARIEALPPRAEQLLSLVALSGRPYHSQVFAAAMDLSLPEFWRLSAELMGAKLLRRTGRHELTCFHDRIRHVAQARVDPLRARSLHARLASALGRQTSPDPADLAQHHDAADELAFAIDAYGRAGEQSLTALAFVRAEQLFARALELLAQQAARSPEAGKSAEYAAARAAFEVGRGHALARSGRSAEAAVQYLRAAEQARGEANTRLRIWAAQHLLQSARVEEGMAAARGLLAELGVRLPVTTAGTLLRLLWDRGVLRVSGGAPPRKTSRPATLLERMRLDALWQLSMPVSWLEPLTAAAISTSHLRLARTLGETTHIARALAEEAAARSMQDDGDPQIEPLLAQARALTDQIGDPTLDVSTSFREATVATFRWDLHRARERLEHAQLVGVERCPDQPWLLTNVRTNLSAIWANSGAHDQLALCFPLWLQEARDRNDRFALTMLEAVGMGGVRHLMRDRAQEARDALVAALAPWPLEPFSFAHLGEMISNCVIELYQGGEGSAHWFEREHARLSRAFILQRGLGRATLLMFRAYANLAAWIGTRGSRASLLFGRVRQDVRELSRLGGKLGSINALGLEAQLLALDGSPERALAGAQAVRARCDACGFDLLGRGMDYLQGAIEGGQSGRARQQAALGFFADLGWQRPERAVTLLCPAIDALPVAR